MLVVGDLEAVKTPAFLVWARGGVLSTCLLAS